MVDWSGSADDDGGARRALSQQRPSHFAVCTDHHPDQFGDHGPAATHRSRSRGAHPDLSIPIPRSAIGAPQAIYISHAAPFYDLNVNGRDLTPEVDFQRRDQRSRGPQLHALAADVLVDGENTLVLRLPSVSDLGNTLIGQVCIGDRHLLLGPWLANWWRQIGIPATCLALLVILGLIAMTLALLQKNMAMWRWYIVCIGTAACRLLYVLSTVMPINDAAWRAVSDLSVLLFLIAMYRLLSHFWAVQIHRWSNLLLLGLVAVRTAMMLAGITTVPVLEFSFWLGVTLLAAGLIIELSIRARHAPLIERASVRWTLGFAIACGMLETLSKFLFPMRSVIGIFPLAITLLIITIGFLLARRASTGTRLLSQATRVLGKRIDATLLTGPAQSTRVWNMLSGELAHDERQYMLDVINEGFGARMLTVLDRIQREYPQSQLRIDIQRALLDLRLMIDAIDESCQSLGSALTTLQRRMEAPLAAAGICSQWRMAGREDLQIISRRKLAELFRCIEELLSNVIQHARAQQVAVDVRVDETSIVLLVTDDGRGLSDFSQPGRGLRNLQLRMEQLNGTFRIAAREDHAGTRAELQLPHL